MTTNQNPIATILGIRPVKSSLTILGRFYQYLPSRDGYSEGMYRADAGHGVSNPCFSISMGGNDAPIRLGHYLTGKRQGVKRVEAEMVLDAAITDVGQYVAGYLIS